MDLGAYVQINDLDELAKKNGIEVPRLRGYRLMKDEEPVTQEEINEMIKEAEINAVECLVESSPSWRWSSDVSHFNEKHDWYKNYYLISSKTDGYRRFVGIRWDRIHGRKRKELKFAIKQEKKPFLLSGICGTNMLAEKMCCTFMLDLEAAAGRKKQDKILFVKIGFLM